MEKSWLGSFGGMWRARGALGCGRGAAKAANGDEQACGSEENEEVKRSRVGSWTRYKTKRSHGQVGSSC
jgi:hypothetical protein